MVERVPDDVVSDYDLRQYAAFPGKSVIKLMAREILDARARLAMASANFIGALDVSAADTADEGADGQLLLMLNDQIHSLEERAEKSERELLAARERITAMERRPTQAEKEGRTACVATLRNLLGNLEAGVMPSAGFLRECHMALTVLHLTAPPQPEAAQEPQKGS